MASIDKTSNDNIQNSVIIETNMKKTVKDFKNLFTRDFPYLTIYQEGKAYFTGDVVYVEPNFYKCLTDGTTTPPPSENWELTNDSVDNYVSDNDILRAFAEAKINFNPDFFKDDDTAIMVFCYLAAHYLVIDLNNAQNPLGLGFMGFTQSKKAGSVSESYAVPQWMLKDQVLSAYAQTGYGRKYLSLIRPYLIGNIMLIPGRTTFG